MVDRAPVQPLNRSNQHSESPSIVNSHQQSFAILNHPQGIGYSTIHVIFMIFIGRGHGMGWDGNCR